MKSWIVRLMMRKDLNFNVIRKRIDNTYEHFDFYESERQILIYLGLAKSKTNECPRKILTSHFFCTFLTVVVKTAVIL